MDLAWSGLAIVLVLLPGIASLWFFFRASQGAAPDLRAANYVVAAVVIAIAIHGIGIASLHFNHRLTFGSTDPTGEELLTAGLKLMLGREDGVNVKDSSELVASTIVGHSRLLLTYGLVTLLGGAGLGLGTGWLYGKRRPPKPNELWFSKENIWTLVDILVEGERLYRGIYHSYEPPSEKSDGYVALVLVSRWIGEPGTARKFTGVRSEVSGAEIFEMILGAIEADTGTPEEAHQRFRMLIDQGALIDYVSKRTSGTPQLVIPWTRVHNINLRQFAVEKRTP